MRSSSPAVRVHVSEPECTDPLPPGGYAELHCLSAFSFQRGASQAQELFERARDLGYTALAITDECSLAGIVRALEASEKTKLPLIVGSEVQIEDGPRLVLLVPDLAAYRALSALITHARRRSDKGEYRLLREDFLQIAQTALALWIPDAAPSAEHAAWVRDSFPQRAWIAVHRHRAADDAARIDQLRALGERFGLPLVAAGDVRYHAPERRPLHDVMTAIRHRVPVAECGHRLLPNGEHHLRPIKTLRALYPAAWLEESLRIAERCRFSMRQLRYDYPQELVPAGHTPTSWLRELSLQGMARRWPQGARPDIAAQIDKELHLIAEMKVEAFFLTVWDIVREAHERNILCQGRGSAANSAVCYALGITEVTPENHGLLFERFLSKERNEAPDIDVDFEHQRREEIIQYIFAKYTRERAALAATVIHYRRRMALREVGWALGIDAEQVEALIRSLAWWDRGDVLDQRFREVGLDPEAALPKRWLALARELVGMPRHLSQHVGGFIISDVPVSQLVPVENAAMADRTIIQWDKDDLESLGLLKVDVLALGMLSALRRSLAMLSAWHGRDFGLRDLPREDPATYDMICAGRTIGVFQIESRAQMSMLPRLQPRNFYDLVIQISIVRPGPIQGGMVHPYLKRRQLREKHPDTPFDIPQRLHKALGRTLGIPLFQEQVMQIAIDGAGFSPGEADQVRRSMAAWKRHGGLEHFRERLLGGMAANGFDPAFADNIYQMVLGFGSYGFPESHAASFALLAYASAWLKRHEPAAFFAGLINSQPMGFYAPAQLVQEARRDGVCVLPVDACVSAWDCTLEPLSTVARFRASEAGMWASDAAPASPAAKPDHGPALRLGLRLVSGLSEASALRIVAARTQHAFTDLDDLVHRAGLDARDRRLLADADALRALSGHRHQARWSALGVERLPGILAGHAAREAQLDLLTAPGEGQDVLDDYASTGLSLRRHPLELLRPRLNRQRVLRAADLEPLPGGRRVKVAGLVINRQRPGTAKGTVFMTLEDETGTHNLILWPAVMEAHRRDALAARLLLVRGELQKSQGVTHVVVQGLTDLSAWIGDLNVSSRDFH
ncbi:error-prone DNA polymerase [Panacagrimonas sp.]|uniref:error-prone DNA polymerase n=1 Tax=Panacagrimonas sp. TaxID=2480088 RepID=UPI003B52DFBE